MFVRTYFISTIVHNHARYSDKAQRVCNSDQNEGCIQKWVCSEQGRQRKWEVAMAPTIYTLVNRAILSLNHARCSHQTLQVCSCQGCGPSKGTGSRGVWSWEWAIVPPHFTPLAQFAIMTCVILSQDGLQLFIHSLIHHFLFYALFLPSAQ